MATTTQRLYTNTNPLFDHIRKIAAGWFEFGLLDKVEEEDGKITITFYSVFDADLFDTAIK